MLGCLGCGCPGLGSAAWRQCCSAFRPRYYSAVESLSIEGAWSYTPRQFPDDRGTFLETFRGEELAASLGYHLDVAQVNCSVSRRGVIRGIHYCDVPPGQAKYVSCARGAILDVVVDIRVGSPSYGAWEAVRLDDAERRSLFIAEGLGHAFMALTDEATVVYLCSTGYTPNREHGVSPLDPEIGITWPLSELPGPPVLSGKDAASPSLREAQQAGQLPRYEDCLQYAERLRAKS
jgi:dTDP-4-dehydrorhamnose 3,5-epimerase